MQEQKQMRNLSLALATLSLIGSLAPSIASAQDSKSVPVISIPSTVLDTEGNAVVNPLLKSVPELSGEVPRSTAVTDRSQIQESHSRQIAKVKDTRTFEERHPKIMSFLHIAVPVSIIVVNGVTLLLMAL